MRPRSPLVRWAAVALATAVCARPAPAEDGESPLEAGVRLYEEAERENSTKKFEDAAKFFEQAHRLAPSDPWPIFRIGLCFARLKDPGKVQTALQRLKRTLPEPAEDHGMVHFLSGVAYFYFDDYARAEKAFTEAALRGFWNEISVTNMFRCRMRIGETHFRARRFRDAVEAFERALKLVEKHYPTLRVEAQRQLAAACYRDGNLETAVALCREIIKHDPGRPEAHLDLGITLTAAMRWAEAAEALERALELDAARREKDPKAPRLTEAHLRLAAAHRGRGRLDEAETHYRTYHELEPARFNANYFYGEFLLEERRDYARAEKYLLRALEISPWCEGPYGDLVKLYHASGQEEKRAAMEKRHVEGREARAKVREERLENFDGKDLCG